MKYTLNIIDTPGFEDTSGIEGAQNPIDQIDEFFSSDRDYLDAICFIVKAQDARLTATQKYILNSIMSRFGKDFESNICTLITFADGTTPQVTAALTRENLPSELYFPFNNSALFAEQRTSTSSSLSPLFWEMGCKSFERFFDKLENLTTKSLSQTKEVLNEREQLKTIIPSILPEVKAGLSMVSDLRKELEIFKTHKQDIENNKDFEYEAEETRQIKILLEPGRHVTNCLRCNLTCHENCIYADDDDKIKCCAMTNGYCTVCVGKCEWSNHKNAKYYFAYTTVKVTKTYTEMKNKYERAKEAEMDDQTFIDRLQHDVGDLFRLVQHRTIRMNQCKNRLEEIALRPDPLSTVEHIELMIEAEKMEGQPGYKQRIEMLNEFKRMAHVDEEVNTFDASYRSAKVELAAAGISDKETFKFFETGMNFSKKMLSGFFDVKNNKNNKTKNG